MSTEKPQGAEANESIASELAKNVEVTGEDLIKSFEVLEALAKGGQSREQTLLAKSVKGEATAEEKKELAQILSGGPSDLQKTVQSQIEVGEDLSKSEGLQKLHAGISNALTELVKAQEKREEDRAKEYKALVDTVIGTAKLVKAQADLTLGMNNQLKDWGKQPVREARGVATPAARELAPAVGQPQKRGVTNEQIMKSLIDIARVAAPDEKSRSGQPYSEVVAQFNTSQELHPAVLRQVIEHIQKSAQ